MTSAITRLRLLGDNADELTKWQADVELREAENERERARKEREARAQQASNDWTNWYARIDERIAEHFKLNFSRDGWLTDSIGGAIGKHTRKVADDLEKEITALREELRAATSKLQERHASLPRYNYTAFWPGPRLVERIEFGPSAPVWEIIICGPKADGTYWVECRTADGRVHRAMLESRA